MEFPFIGGAYLGRSSNLDSQRCKNLYPEVDKQGGREITLTGTPGLKSYATIGTPFSNTYTIASGGDDGYVRVNDTTFYSSGSTVLCGWHGGFDYVYHCFLRFANVDISQGSTILSAVITFMSGISMGYTSELTTRWYCNDVDNAVAPTSYAEFAALAKTTAYIDWSDDTDWQGDVEYDSDDLSTIVEEVISRPGWVSGNALMVMGYYQSKTGSYRHMVWDSYDGSPLTVPSFAISGG